MANPICPVGCASALPVVSFSECSPEVNLSEIQYVYVAKSVAADFTDWTVITEWTTRLSQTVVVGDDTIRTLTVIGDKPAPARTEKEISGGRKVSANKTHTLNFTIDETNEINHELLRMLECGGTFKIWYETQGGLLFGGNEGIEASIFLDMILGRGREEVASFAGVAEWKNRFTEERCVSPIAH